MPAARLDEQLINRPVGSTSINTEVTHRTVASSLWPKGRRMIYDGLGPKGSTARGTLRWSGTEAQESKDIEALRLAYI